MATDEVRGDEVVTTLQGSRHTLAIELSDTCAEAGRRRLTRFGGRRLLGRVFVTRKAQGELGLLDLAHRIARQVGEDAEQAG
jgi:hypothetical protein